MSYIRKSLSAGIIYTAIARYSSILFSIIIAAILSRLLTPEDFGVVALVTVFITFFNLMSNFGIGQAVVQNQSLSIEDIETIFSFSIVLSFILSAFFLICAPLIADFYNENQLTNISRVLSLSVLFYSLQIIPRALLQKSLKFKQIGIITVLAQVISGVVAIVLAYKGFGCYALVIRSIVVSLLSLTLFYYLTPIKILFKIKFEAIKKIIRFSVFNFLFNFINYFSRNGDNLLVGKFLGSSSLGYYDKSYCLMMLPVQNLTNVITPVLMPVLSNYQDDHDIIFNAYLKVVKILAIIGFPLSVLLFFSAYEIINIIFGSQWDNSVPVFKIISLTIGIQMIYASAGSVFLAINRAGLLFIYGIIGASILLCGISYGVFWSKNIETVGYGIAIAFTINFFIVFYMLIHIALQKSLLRFLKLIISPLFISLVIGFFLFIYSKVESENIFYSLAAKLFISLFIFGLLLVIKKENRSTIKLWINKYIIKKSFNMG